MKKVIIGSFAIASIFILGSCAKDNTSDNNSNNQTGTSQFRVLLKDAPTDLDSVFVDIREVRINMNADSTDSTSTSGWLTLPTNIGIYDLLQLQNGVDTTISSATIPTGTIKQIRLILGDSNRVVESGVSYPLTIPSGSESGLKVMIHKNVTSSLDSLVIDFDAALSVRRENDGTYKLRPVLQVH